jgi:hypothetical protein
MTIYGNSYQPTNTAFSLLPFIILLYFCDSQIVSEINIKATDLLLLITSFISINLYYLM